MFEKIVLFIFVIGVVHIRANDENFQDTITFTVFSKSGDQLMSSTDGNITSFGCDSSGKVAIVVHGWRESIDTEWVGDLVVNLLEHRGGCIIVMDYSNHSMDPDYFDLVGKFPQISQVLLGKLFNLEKQGFSADNFFMYGFSFGGQLVIDSGMHFGEQKIAEIDGPGFNFSPNLIPSMSAKNVQCIHTSINKGTIRRNCHQDWLLGRCGRSQSGAGKAPKGSHGLCPYFYNAAFTHDFYATENLYNCPSRRIATDIPKLFKMGYMETRKTQVNGDLFSPTSECYPYNNYSEAPIQSRGFRRLARVRLSRLESRMRKLSCQNN